MKGKAQSGDHSGEGQYVSTENEHLYVEERGGPEENILVNERGGFGDKSRLAEKSRNRENLPVEEDRGGFETPFYETEIQDSPDFLSVSREWLKGRGAQLNSSNPYLKSQYVQAHAEGLDEALLSPSATQYTEEFPKKIINPVKSPDIPLPYSMNPYQGCEHGCVYCYARNTHHYWGLSAGLDFERRIIIKKNAAALLEKEIRNPRWEPAPIMLSGNTDCYQPVEKQLRITRSMLEVLHRYKHPVGIITKNALILRDLDLLREMAAEGLVHVAMSITTLDEGLRRKLEPRTVSGARRLQAIQALTEAGVPVSVMVAPIIPGLNNTEIPDIIRDAANAGALNAGMTMVRLNGAVGEVFEDWLRQAFPEKANKVMRQIAETHGGSIQDSRFGARMRGEGQMAESIRALFQAAKKRYMHGREVPPYNLEAFIRTHRHGHLSLFQG